MFQKKIKRESSRILTKEHENILKVVDALTKECDLIENGKEIDKDFFRKEIDKDFFRKIIDFIRNYADKFHHAKEEEILFKEFNKCAEKDSECLHCNPVEQMLSEHDEGRNFVKGMEESLEKNDKQGLIENARGYANLIQEHIFKEDNILYPMADDILNESIEKEMLEKFKRIANINKNKEMKHLNFVRSLKNE